MEQLKNLVMCGKILLKWIVEKWCGGGPDRVSLARDRWRNVVSTVMKLQVLNFLTS